MAKRKLTWQMIEARASELGAGYWAIRKWIERGEVPAKWKLALGREFNVHPDLIVTDGARSKT